MVFWIKKGLRILYRNIFYFCLKITVMQQVITYSKPEVMNMNFFSANTLFYFAFINIKYFVPNIFITLQEIINHFAHMCDNSLVMILNP